MLTAYLVLLLICYCLSFQLSEKRYFNRIVLPLATIVFSVIVIGGSQGDPDYLIYKNMYERGTLLKGLGFQTIMSFCKSLGVSYELFRILIAICSNLLVFSTVNKFAIDKRSVYLLYLIYPLCFDAVQLRNYLAMSIFIFAIQFLLKNNYKIYNKIIYVALILMAASIQIAVIVYLPIVFIVRLHENKYLKLCLKIIVVVSIIIGLNRNFVTGVLNQYSTLFFNSEYGLENYIKVNNNLGWIINAAQQFANFGLIYMAKKYCTHRWNLIGNHETQERLMNYINIIYDINVYMFMFLPLLVIDENYTRIIRNVMPLNFIVYSFVGVLMRRTKKRITKFSRSNRLVIGVNGVTIGIIAYQIVLFYLVVRTYWDNIIIQLLTNNWIL